MDEETWDDGEPGYWRKAGGATLKIEEMSRRHLENTIKLIIRHQAYLICQAAMIERYPAPKWNWDYVSLEKPKLQQLVSVWRLKYDDWPFEEYAQEQMAYAQIRAELSNGRYDEVPF